jgi:hypothetical protein
MILPLTLECSMKWVQLKMEQLGVLGNPNYKITALMDHLAMITVQSDKFHEKKIFDCKPLGIIWAKFPEVRILCLSVSLMDVMFSHGII